MNIQDIYQLLDRFEDSSLAELNLEMEGTKVVLKRADQVQKQSMPLKAPLENVSKTLTMQETENDMEVLGTAVEAPLVGTFYAAPSPDADPFVRVGTKVKKGEVVGIIEAMKLMNEITAPCDGIVEVVNVENGQMVEYQQVLMRIS